MRRDLISENVDNSGWPLRISADVFVNMLALTLSLTLRQFYIGCIRTGEIPQTCQPCAYRVVFAKFGCFDLFFDGLRQPWRDRSLAQWPKIQIQLSIL